MNKEEKSLISFLKFSILDYEELDTSVLEYIDEKKKKVLNYIDKLQKENEELNIENINLKRNQIIDKSSIPNQENFYDYYNFISKDKIRNKIKELEKKHKIIGDKIGVQYHDQNGYLGQIEVLQELLEEE